MISGTNFKDEYVNHVAPISCDRPVSIVIFKKNFKKSGGFCFRGFLFQFTGMYLILKIIKCGACHTYLIYLHFIEFEAGEHKGPFSRLRTLSNC